MSALDDLFATGNTTGNKRTGNDRHAIRAYSLSAVGLDALRVGAELGMLDRAHA
jgi:hypothetical protein